MFIRQIGAQVRHTVLHFSLSKAPLVRFSTTKNCERMSALVIEKLTNEGLLSSLTRLTLDAHVLTHYLEQNIAPALADQSGFPLSYEIELSKDMVGINIESCTLVLKPETITALARGRLHSKGVVIIKT